MCCSETSHFSAFSGTHLLNRIFPQKRKKIERKRKSDDNLRANNEESLGWCTNLKKNEPLADENLQNSDIMIIIIIIIVVVDIGLESDAC